MLFLKRWIVYVLLAGMESYSDPLYENVLFGDIHIPQLATDDNGDYDLCYPPSAVKGAQQDPRACEVAAMSVPPATTLTHELHTYENKFTFNQVRKQNFSLFAKPGHTLCFDFDETVVSTSHLKNGVPYYKFDESMMLTPSFVEIFKDVVTDAAPTDDVKICILSYNGLPCSNYDMKGPLVEHKRGNITFRRLKGLGDLNLELRKANDIAQRTNRQYKPVRGADLIEAIIVRNEDLMRYLIREDIQITMEVIACLPASNTTNEKRDQRTVARRLHRNDVLGLVDDDPKNPTNGLIDVPEARFDRGYIVFGKRGIHEVDAGQPISAANKKNTEQKLTVNGGVTRAGLNVFEIVPKEKAPPPPPISTIPTRTPSDQLYENVLTRARTPSDPLYENVLTRGYKIPNKRGLKSNLPSLEGKNSQDAKTRAESCTRKCKCQFRFPRRTPHRPNSMFTLLGKTFIKYPKLPKPSGAFAPGFLRYVCFLGV